MSVRTRPHSWLAILATVTTALAIAIVIACKDDESPVAPEIAPPAEAISDALHGSASTGFFFLPPLVPDPSAEFDPEGFDATLSPEVEICELSGDKCAETPQLEDFPLLFTMTSGPGSETVRLAESAEPEEHYVVNWHTGDWDLEDGTTYRIRVLVAGTELGYADVDVVDGGQGLKGVDTEEYVALRDGRTLPINFRIEYGAVYVVGPEETTVDALDGKVTLHFQFDESREGLGVTVRELAVTDYPDPDRVVPGSVYDLGPDGTFDPPVRVTIGYDENELDGVDERTLRLHKVIDGKWELIWNSTVDTDANTVSGDAYSFTPYGAGEADAASLVFTSAGESLSGIGSQVTLEPEAYAEDGNLIVGKVYNWSSLNPSIVTVDASGVVTAVGAGQATVRAEVDGAVAYVLMTVATPGIPQVNVWAPEESGTAERLTAVWGTSPSDVFAVGDNGTILHRDGSGWGPPMGSGTSEPLSGVWGASASDVYAVGANGTVLHYDGSTWSAVSDAGMTGDVAAVWGSSPVDVYALEGARVHHFDGVTWSVLNELEGELTDIWGTSATSFYVVGHTNLDESFVYHYDGTDWVKQASWNWGEISDLWGSSPDDILGVGYFGVVHFDGTSWTQTEEVHDYLLDVSGTSAADVYAVGLWPGAPWAEIYRYDGSEWVPTRTTLWGIHRPQHGVWATSGDVFSVGPSGGIVRGLRDATLTLDPSNHTFGGYLDEVDLSVEVRDAEGNVVGMPCSYLCDLMWGWGTSDPLVAQVDVGSVTAAGWGTATILAYAPGGAEGTATVTVPGVGHVVDGSGRIYGPLPAIIYALAENEVGDDIYPLGPDSGAKYRFSLFDTGSTKVRIYNETPYWWNIWDPQTGQGNPNGGIVCNVPNRLTDANWWSSDVWALGLSGPVTARVRLNGLSAIDPVSLGAPIGQMGSAAEPQVEVTGVEARPEPTPPPGEPILDVTLIGAPVISDVVALIDYTQKVRVSGYEFYPDLISASYSGITGFTLIDYVEGPDITFYAPGDPAIPTMDVELDLASFGMPERFLLTNVEFRYGDNSATATAGPNPSLMFLYDTGTKTTVIGDEVAGLLGLVAGAGSFDCLNGTDNGYVIGSVFMSSPGGGYIVHNPSVCWSQAGLKSSVLHAVIGANLFDQVPVLFDGPGYKLGIGAPTSTPNTWEEFPGNCSN